MSVNFPLRDALTQYSEWLEKQGYMDCDWWAEEPGHETSVDRFLEESPMAGAGMRMGDTEDGYTNHGRRINQLEHAVLVLAGRLLNEIGIDQYNSLKDLLSPTPDSEEQE